MMNHEIFAYKTLVSAILYLFWGCCFGNGGATFLSYDYLELYGANVTYLRKLLSYLLLYMIISLMIAMMRNLFILIALVCMVFVFMIVSPDGIRCVNKGTTKYPSSAVRRKYPKSKKNRILNMQSNIHMK